ncbi:MAG: tetratricopeptide repeat protein [Desulfobacterales bacterium]|nr:tetratricopeptide repeat protein [Desulfobacterales bacterium]
MGRAGNLILFTSLCFAVVLTCIPFCFADAVDAANAGMEANKKGDKEKAKVLFRSALKSNELSKENYIVVNNELCGVLWSESKRDQALDCYSETLYLSPDDPVARLKRGTLYHQTGEYDKAVKDLTRYISVAPRDHMGYIYRGISFRASKKYDQAISDLSHALWLRPGHGEGYILRGNTYFRTGNYNLAMADFKKAVKTGPENPYAYQAMAWLFAACPNRDFRDGAAAVELAEKALRLETADTPDPVILATLAAAYAESGMFRKAVATQKQAVAQAGRGKFSDISKFDVSKEELGRRLELYRNSRVYEPE